MADAMKRRDAYGRRRRPGRARARRGAPLLRAVRHPADLIDRFVLGMDLGPPRARTPLQQPAMQALARRLAASGEASETTGDGPNDDGS